MKAPSFFQIWNGNFLPRIYLLFFGAIGSVLYKISISNKTDEVIFSPDQVLFVLCPGTPLIVLILPLQHTLFDLPFA